jgi:hypothetical protein
VRCKQRQGNDNTRAYISITKWRCRNGARTLELCDCVTMLGSSLPVWNTHRMNTEFFSWKRRHFTDNDRWHSNGTYTKSFTILRIADTLLVVLRFSAEFRGCPGCQWYILRSIYYLCNCLEVLRKTMKCLDQKRRPSLTSVGRSTAEFFCCSWTSSSIASRHSGPWGCACVEVSALHRPFALHRNLFPLYLQAYQSSLINSATYLTEKDHSYFLPSPLILHSW